MNSILPVELLPSEGFLDRLSALATFLAPGGGVADLMTALKATAADALEKVEAVRNAEAELRAARAAHAQALDQHKVAEDDLAERAEHVRKWEAAVVLRERAVSTAEPKIQAVEKRAAELETREAEIEAMRAELARKLSAITELART